MGIYLGALDATPEQQVTTRLVATGFSPVYAPSLDPKIGYVLFLRDSALQAQPFDLAKLEMAGEPVRIADHVRSIFEFGFFGVSDNGILAYQTGDAIRRTLLQLTWFDRGMNLSAAAAPGTMPLFGCPPMLHAWQSRGSIFERQLEHLAGRFARKTLTPLTSARVGDADPAGRRTARTWPMPRTVQAAQVSIRMRRMARVASNCCSNRAASEI